VALFLNKEFNDGSRFLVRFGPVHGTFVLHLRRVERLLDVSGTLLKEMTSIQQYAIHTDKCISY